MTIHTDSQIANLSDETLSFLPIAICIIHGPEFVVRTANRKQLEIWQKSFNEVLNKPLFVIFPEIVSQEFKALLTNVYESGNPYTGFQQSAQFLRNGTLETAYFNFFYEPILDDVGKVESIMVVSTEIAKPEHVRPAQPDTYNLSDHDSQKNINRKILLPLYEKVVTKITDAVLITESHPKEAPFGPRIIFVNEAFTRMTGYSAEDVIGKHRVFYKDPRSIGKNYIS